MWIVTKFGEWTWTHTYLVQPRLKRRRWTADLVRLRLRCHSNLLWRCSAPCFGHSVNFVEISFALVVLLLGSNASLDALIHVGSVVLPVVHTHRTTETKGEPPVEV